MSLELYMVGVIVEDMAKSVEFYRRLGVEIPEGSETKPFVEIRMGAMTFFLGTTALNRRWDPAKIDPSGGGYRVILELYLKTQAEVDAKYAEMIGYGYQAHLAPYITPFKMYFAMIYDPDGNTILLSDELDSENR